MAHKFSDFEKYIGTPLQQFIIPIIPAKNADGTPTTLRPSSSLKPENLGKIPGLWSRRAGPVSEGGKTTAARPQTSEAGRGGNLK
jgi:hypothetical protein